MQTFVSERGQLFKRVMPLAFRNLAIAQQRDKERYSLVRGKGWDRPKAKFQPSDYVLLKQHTKNCMLPLARPHILRVVELRPSGVAVLEGRGAARCQRQVKDIAHNPIPILDHNLQQIVSTRAPRCNAECAVAEPKAPRWCCAIGAIKATTSGAYPSRC